MDGQDIEERVTVGGRAFRATSFDVAAAAGVSQSTVSRALAGDPVVSEATRLRVAEAARRLNYQVDRNAARLRTGKTGTLAVVVICRAGQDRKDINPFTFALLGSTCAAASARGFETLVSFQDTPDSFNGLYQEQRKADGLIVLGSTENAEAWHYFRERAETGDAVVFWGSPHDELDWVRSDNRAGARLATRHLIDQGFQSIACIASQTSPQRQFWERYEGYAEVMTEAGLEPRLVAFEEGLSREEQGQRAVASLVSSEEPFDAVFAVCDQIALGALGELRARGFAVPRDVGLVGFDGIRDGAHATPPLSTIEPDFQAAGAMLVERLLAAIAGLPTDKRRVPVSLLARGSSVRG